MSVVGTYTSTFGAVGFRLTNTQLALPKPGVTLRAQKDPIPYGNLATIQIGGASTDDLTLTLILNTADLAALETAARAGTAQTLTLLGDTPRAAVLSKLGQAASYLEGETIVQATFMFDS